MQPLMSNPRAIEIVTRALKQFVLNGADNSNSAITEMLMCVVTILRDLDALQEMEGAQTMTTKECPDQFDCYAKAERDEPMFVLLARDPLAPELVRLWARARWLSAVEQRDIDKSNRAMECAKEMEQWASANPDHGILARMGKK